MTLLTTSLPLLSGLSIQPVSGRSWVRLPLGAQKILLLSMSTWEGFFFIYTLSKSPIYLSFIHIYHFDTLRLAVSQDTCHTYKNLQSSIWHCSPRVSHSSVVRASNRYLEGHRFDSRWGLRKFFFWVFRLENASSLFTQSILLLDRPYFSHSEQYKLRDSKPWSALG